MKHLIASLLMFGCAGGIEIELEPACIFTGVYEFGGIPSEGCEAFKRISTYDRYQDECATELTAMEGQVTCVPGDPVQECDGYGTLGSCEFVLYVRRLAP